jgi:hypothetical protein
MFRTHLLSIAALFAIASAAQIEPSAAQGQQQQAPAVLPSDKELDALLAAKKWNEIGAASSLGQSAEAVTRMMNWLRTRIDTGGGFFLSFLYARNLWNAGSYFKVDDPDKDLRIAAAMITLYAYEVIVIDGAKCADTSAPSRRADQLFMYGGRALDYLKTKPEELKAKVIDAAIGYEKRTEQWRKDDDLLCRDGMEETKAGIDAGTTREVPTPPGYFGKAVAVETPPGFVPRFLAPSVYVPLQEKARSAMKANLAKLLH